MPEDYDTPSQPRSGSGVNADQPTRPAIHRQPAADPTNGREPANAAQPADDASPGNAAQPVGEVRTEAAQARADHTIEISPVPLAAQPAGPVGSAGQPYVSGSAPESDAERTQTIPPIVGNVYSGATGLPPWETSARPPEPPVQPPEPPTWTDFGGGSGSGDGGAGRRSTAFRAAVTAGIAAAVFGLLYVGDLVMSAGDVPRGTVVAGVEIGGMSKTAAEQKLQQQLGPHLNNRPVVVRAGDATATINPQTSGLTMDWEATIEQAGAQPLNPITRLTSFFSTHEVAPVSRGDRAQVAVALHQVVSKLNRQPVEGGITFQGTRPVAVGPVSGRTVDMAQATSLIVLHWATGQPVDVPFAEQPVSTTPQGVQQALTQVAQPAVSGPVTVTGEQGKVATLPPEVIAGALHFAPDGRGGLASTVDVPALIAAARPQLASTERPSVDAQVVLDNGQPAVHPSVDGYGVDWNKSLEHVADVLKQTGNRTVPALYQPQPARFTTDQANALGIKEPVSEFTTGGFEQASGVNIHRVADQVNGALIKPGDSFSLNGYTGPRGVPQGYVESGVIENGRPGREVGGGISQFATTLFNTEYFAGMQDVEHKEHSFYIKRYPMGREATVWQDPDGKSEIDVKFKNTSPTGIMIQTIWTPQSITVRFWGTKTYDVQSKTSPPSNPTPPNQEVIPPGQPCSETPGEPGFTVYDQRILRVLANNQVITEEPRKVVYDPEPIVHCPPPPPGPPPPH